MFGPRPVVAIAEMLRVLKPGGVIAFSTWPPELYTGRMFNLVGKYLRRRPALLRPLSGVTRRLFARGWETR
jgi:SAM-dependent methyltransferase